jgi:hypothetical protein
MDLFGALTSGIANGEQIKNLLGSEKTGFRGWRGKRYDYYRHHRIPRIRRPAMDYYDNHWLPPYEIPTGPRYPVYYFQNDSYMGGTPKIYYQYYDLPGKFISPY